MCKTLFNGPDVTATYLKNKSSIWGDLGWAACRSIRILWLTDELAQFSNFHCGHPDVPRFYDLTCGQRKTAIAIGDEGNTYTRVSCETNLFPTRRRNSSLCLCWSQTGFRPGACPHNARILCHQSWAALCLCLPFSPAGTVCSKKDIYPSLKLFISLNSFLTLYDSRFFNKHQHLRLNLYYYILI